MSKPHDRRIEALEAEAAFQAAADKMGGWDELTRWARENPSQCKEVLLRFLPERFFKQGSTDKTLGELVGECNYPIERYDDESIIRSIKYHTERMNEYLADARRRGLPVDQP